MGIILCRNIKGGAGTTIMSLNLACAYGQMTMGKKPVILQLSKYPDLHCYIQPQKDTNASTLMYLICKENAAQEGLKNCLHEYANFYALPSPKYSTRISEKDEEEMNKLLDLLEDTHSTVILDVDSNMPEKYIEKLTSRSALQIIFTNTDSASQEKTKEFLSRTGNDQRKKTFIVFNQCLGGKNTESLAGYEVIGALPSAPEEIIWNMVHKTPFMMKKNNRLKKAMVALASKIHTLTSV